MRSPHPAARDPTCRTRPHPSRHRVRLGSTAATATVHPGVQTLTEGAQCASNFVFTNGSDVYLGQAAHCSGTGAATDTNGCDSASLPIGTKVDVDGAGAQGTMVYDSWIAMQQAGESAEETCAYNDLALIRLDPSDVPKTNPSIPDFGGPSGVGTASAGSRSTHTATRSSASGVTLLSPKNGLVVSTTAGGWSYTVYTATPGIPGDSGSAFLDSQGQALGILSTVAIAPLPASNGVGAVGKEIAYAPNHGFPGWRSRTARSRSRRSCSASCSREGFRGT